MIDFPASPTVGQQFTAAGVTWTYDGVKWTASGLGVAYLPLAGGTMLGPIVLAADPAAPLQAATKQYVDAGKFGGYVNKFRNGTMDVWQRGSPVSLTAGAVPYTADGWMGALTGQAGGVTQIAVANVASPSWGAIRQRFLMQLWVGAPGGATQAQITQRIEGNVAAQLTNQPVTVQIKVYNAGATVTPTLTVNVPTTQDTYPGNTVVNAVPLQPCPAGQWTQLAYTFNPGVCTTGMAIWFAFGAALAAQGSSLYFAEADIRATPGWPVGLCANPPPPELRPNATELAFCQRYYEAGWTHAYGYGTNGNLLGYHYQYKVTKRAAPTVVLTNNFAGGVGTVSQIDTQQLDTFSAYRTATATGQINFIDTFTASAEL